MIKPSEELVRDNCPHCNPTSFALKHPLYETADFWIVCDVHPITTGHVLIVPKQHLSSVGAYPQEIFEKFLTIYSDLQQFILISYGSVATFEHGVFGQSVFHSHVHLVPFKGKVEDIVPEGSSHMSSVQDLTELRSYLAKNGGYLFFSVGQAKWVIDPSLSAPRFFRDRFARLLGDPERGNWENMQMNPQLMAKAEGEMSDLEERWRNYKRKPL